MSHQYHTISWTPFKRRYDLTVGILIVAFMATFAVSSAVFYPQGTTETLLIRSLGVTAFLLLQVTLSVGPLCRLSPRWLPLLYNRRHLGLLTFLLALSHGIFSIFQFHALGDRNPLISVLLANPNIDSLSQFPFQPLGLAALLILLLLAATSHDFWLTVLTPVGWKRLHMLAYAAYVLIVLHVGLGVVQVEPSPVYPILLGLSTASLTGLHLMAGWKEWRRDRTVRWPGPDGFVEFCRADEIPDQRAQVRMVGAERVAVFRDGDSFAAFSNVCPHQNGPLGEGAIVDGYVTCPWHGFQFRLDNGCAPEPYADKVPTYTVLVRDGIIWVKARPNPLGARVAAAQLQDTAARLEGASRERSRDA